MNTRRSYTMGPRADAVAKTRERIVEAARTLLLAEAYEDVTLNAIAAEAGVSHQTVLNHFESKEGVARAFAEQLRTATIETRDAARPGDVEGAIGILVGGYEAIGDANVRWAATAERLGSLAPLLDEARAIHQAWLERIFDDLLPTGPTARRLAVHALHVATDVYSWKLLRRDLGLERVEVEHVMADLARAALHASAASHPPNPRSSP